MTTEHRNISEMREVLLEQVKDAQIVKELMETVAHEISASSMDSDLRNAWCQYAIDSLDEIFQPH